MNDINSKTLKKKKRACKALLDEYQSVITDNLFLPLFEQSLNAIRPILQEHYSVNITVHETRSDLDYIIQQYPQEYDHDLPCIDIHQQVNANGIGHVSLINPKMYAYKTKYGLQCKFCKVHRTNGVNCRHKCSTFNDSNCLACYRIGLPNAIITKNSINTYCDLNFPKHLQILSQDKRFNQDQLNVLTKIAI